MKSQTQIIQFILFFLISISIFSLICSYLFSLSQLSQDRLLSSFRELVASFTSGFLIFTYTGCKYCNYSYIMYGIPYQVFDNFHEINTTNNILYVKSVPLQRQILASTHNLNLTTNFTGFYSTGFTSSFFGLNRTSIVSFSFNKSKNNFKIGSSDEIG